MLEEPPTTIMQPSIPPHRQSRERGLRRQDAEANIRPANGAARELRMRRVEPSCCRVDRTRSGWIAAFEATTACFKPSRRAMESKVDRSTLSRIPLVFPAGIRTLSSPVAGHAH